MTASILSRARSPRTHRVPGRLLLAAVTLVTVAGSLQAQRQFVELARMPLPNDSLTTFTVALGDVDGDGDLDMVLGAMGGPVRLHVNDGYGRYSEAPAAQFPFVVGTVRSVALVDVDGDADVDLVIGDNTGVNMLFVNNGAGVFTDVTAAQMPTANDATSAVVSGDVDGDGDLDLVIANEGQQNRLYLNSGAGTFTDATAGRLPVDADATTSLGLGDVDGDGDLDLILASSFQQDRLYLNNGGGTFTDATAGSIPTAGGATSSVALGDVDGDGDLDVVFGGNGSQNRLLRNNGAGTFVDVTATQMPVDNVRTMSIAIGDLDGDGDLDLVIGNAQSTPAHLPEPNRIYLNNGAGVFTDATATRMPGNASVTLQVALGDVDRDGDLDIVCANEVTDQLYFNVQRQLHAPNAPAIGTSYALDAYLRYGPVSTADVAAIHVSSAPASIPLPPFGTVGIDPVTAVALPLVILSQPAGVGTASLAIPNAPQLIGQSLFLQTILFAIPGDLRLSNVVADVIQ